MELKINDFIIKEEIFSNKRRIYLKAVKLHPQNGEIEQFICQKISKPPIISSIAWMFKKIFTVSNRNVIKYIEFTESPTQYYIFMEQLNQGNLDQIISTKNLIEDQAKSYLREILNGLKSLHENQINFVDLSPKNIFIINDEIKLGQIHICIDRIANLNTAQEFDEFGIVMEIIPPEILQNQATYSIASDLYSTSVLYFKMIYKRYPFNGSTKEELIQNIKENNIDFRSQDQLISDETIDFLKQTLKFDQKQRLNWTQVYSHPLLGLLNININLVQQTLSSISLNKLITRQNLMIPIFDCEQNRIFYQELELKSPSKQRSKIDNTQDQQYLEQFHDQLQQVQEILREQRNILFKKQLDFYIEQRNMYSSLSQTLSYVRIFDQEFQSVTLQFIILKLIFLTSQSLISQILEITSINKTQQGLGSDLQEECDNLWKKIEQENQIIISQFSQSYKKTERNIERGNLDKKIKEIVNKTCQYTLFEFLRDQANLFIQKIPTFKCIQNDVKIQKEITLQALLSLALVVSYLLKQDPIQILRKSPIEYQEFIMTLSTEELQEECKLKQISIDQAFGKIQKSQFN